MKEKVIIGLNVVLAFAVALLFLLHFKEKAQKNLLTRAEMQQQEMSLQQRQQEMSVLNQKLTEELGKDEQKIQKQLYDSVKLVTDLYNQEYKYQVIFNSSTSVSIITADKSLD